MIQYYVEIRQLSLSKEEYRFWDLMLQLNESGGISLINSLFRSSVISTMSQIPMSG